MRKPAMKRKQGVDVVIALGPAPSKGPKMMEEEDYGDDMKSRCDALEERIKRLESMLLEDEEEMDEDEEYTEDEGLDYEEEEDEDY